MSRLPWHGPLFGVRGHLAERYALALHRVTGRECPLTEFAIDRMGWSPQLAAIFGDAYLGEQALRSAIIFSPDQGEAPPLRRRFSYEAPLIERVYLDARPTLLSLLADEPVVIEFDNGLVFCRDASDVVNIQQITTRIDTPRATLAHSATLLELAQGLHQGARLLDNDYIDRMLALVAQVGDPRRRVQPPALTEQAGSLWADVYGGVYVLRPPLGQYKPLVVAVRPDNELRALPVAVFALDDPELNTRLHREGYLHYPAPHTLLTRRLGDLAAEALLNIDQMPATDPDARRRQIAQYAEAQRALPALYWELDAERKRVAAGSGYAPERLSVTARWALSAPNRDADVVGHLLARFVRFDYRLLAMHHRRSIEAEWGRYTSAKQRYFAGLFPYMAQGFVQPSVVNPAP
jgi:hypothetical protein